MLATAQASVDAMQKEVSRFKESGDHQFAPQTLVRIDQYLGAAMLAAEQNKGEETEAALAKTAEKLDEAKQTAASFRKQYQTLLSLRIDAMETVKTMIASTQAVNATSTQEQLDSANLSFDLAILTRERGELNKTQEHIENARRSYEQAILMILPQLSELTASAISKAVSEGAKRYAPVTYQTAIDRLAEIRAYIDGISDSRPSNPTAALRLAREAESLAIRVKAWRKHRGSHEDIILKARDFRLRLANMLEISKETDALLTNIPSRQLLSETARLKKELVSEREAHKQELTELKLRHEQDIQSRLLAQTDAFKQTQHDQISGMKEAFRAKLERETFEKKRRKKVLAMFNKDEADIMINLDGSMLIRLGSLQFASAKSKIDSQYFDLLSRLKNTLDAYPQRTARIEGHTDDQGGVKPNQILSLQRAEAVREFLIAAGVDGTRLKALGYGEVRPIASNAFPQGRAMNRRIDIVINAAE